MVKVVTVNVRGMRRKWTRTAIFRELRNIKADICLLQECHITENDVQEWKKQWKGHFLVNEGSTRSKGEMILIRKELNCEAVHVLDTDKRPH